MAVNPTALTLRAKKLGVLIRDARLGAGMSLAEGAHILGVSAETFEEYELGSKSPSLPELEVLAYALNTPVEHFWGRAAGTVGDTNRRQLDTERLMGLRQRKVGALLRQARLTAGLSLKELAEKTWSSATRLEAYELGEMPVPMPDLEALSEVLDRPLIDFQDHHGPIGAWAAQQERIRNFLELSPELQAFVSKPVNRPYLDLALRLSGMDVNKLRSVAEGLLEITF